VKRIRLKPRRKERSKMVYDDMICHDM